jgi:hypothetical protein
VLGVPYFVCTVTRYFTGTLVEVTDHELVLVDAAWVAHTGRFGAALATGKLEEVEPYPDGEHVIINRSALVDVCRWRHPLPRKALTEGK